MMTEDWKAVPLAELEELRKDAARYRWLREQKASSGGYWVAHGRINQGLSQWYGEPLDSAIDAAMMPNAGIHRAAEGRPVE
jgi:hypothetical protein